MVVPDYQVAEVTHDRIVPVDSALTRHEALIDLPPEFLTMSDGDAAVAAGVAFSLQRTRAAQCNSHLDKIATLGENHE